MWNPDPPGLGLTVGDEAPKVPSYDAMPSRAFALVKLAAGQLTRQEKISRSCLQFA